MARFASEFDWNGKATWLLVPILWLALALRLTWFLKPGYEIDVNIFVEWMRTAAQNGVIQTYAATKVNAYLPLAMYFLNLMGEFAPIAQGAPPQVAELVVLRLSVIFADLLTIAALYTIGRWIADARAGICVALFYALCPFN